MKRQSTVAKDNKAGVMGQGKQRQVWNLDSVGNENKMGRSQKKCGDRKGWSGSGESSAWNEAAQWRPVRDPWCNSDELSLLVPMGTCTHMILWYTQTHIHRNKQMNKWTNIYFLNSIKIVLVDNWDSSCHKKVVVVEWFGHALMSHQVATASCY